MQVTVDLLTHMFFKIVNDRTTLKTPVKNDIRTDWENVEEEASYVCDNCGEEIVVPIDLAAGANQEYVEDCPVCCSPSVIHVQVYDGDVRVWAESE